MLEKVDHAADTVYRYQKGKLVMSTPDVLPLRSDFSFERGIREQVLDIWNQKLEALGINIRYNAEVTAILRRDGSFQLILPNAEAITADKVVLAIGLQGNLRKLEVPGAERVTHVQYQLDDPEEYEDEAIVVIGAGDAGIENAVALAKQNDVTIVNRRDEFARVKDGNRSLVLQSIESGVLSCVYNAEVLRLDPATTSSSLRAPMLPLTCAPRCSRLAE